MARRKSDVFVHTAWCTQRVAGPILGCAAQISRLCGGQVKEAAAGKPVKGELHRQCSKQDTGNSCQRLAPVIPKTPIKEFVLSSEISAIVTRRAASRRPGASAGRCQKAQWQEERPGRGDGNQGELEPRLGWLPRVRPRNTGARAKGPSATVRMVTAARKSASIAGDACTA